MSGPESNYLAWVAKADHDFLNIENKLAGQNAPWDTVCFHAQQAGKSCSKHFSCITISPWCAPTIW
jgi:hypothetical protein